MSAEPVPELWHASLDAELPAELPVGRGCALAITGWVFHRRSELQSVVLKVDDRVEPADAHSMPRLDVYKGIRADGDEPAGAAYRSGFWGIVDLPAAEEPVDVDIFLCATTVSGETFERRLAHMSLLPGEGRATDPAARPSRICICMATFDPDPALLRRQLDSIRAQTHGDWVCVINDDSSRPDLYAALEREVAGDERFSVARNERRLGFYHNFGRALERVPADAGLVALSDQDDYWYPEKLATLIGALAPEVTLAYCDQRIVGEDGRVVSPTYWSERRNDFGDLPTLISTNTVTGAASLFRRELLDAILPLPPRHSHAFHDHWIALVAQAHGRIAFVDRALYDYTQHGAQVMGHAIRPREAAAATSARDALLTAEADYFEVHHRRRWLCRMLLTRCADQLDRRTRRALRLGAEGETTRAGRRAVRLRALRDRRRRELTLGHDEDALRGVRWRDTIARLGRGDPAVADWTWAVRYGGGLVDYGPWSPDLGLAP